jgi:hypothetical protein
MDMLHAGLPLHEYVSHNYFKIQPDGSNNRITNLTDNDTLGMIGTWSNDEIILLPLHASMVCRHLQNRYQ